MVLFINLNHIESWKSILDYERYVKWCQKTSKKFFFVWDNNCFPVNACPCRFHCQYAYISIQIKFFLPELHLDTMPDLMRSSLLVYHCGFPTDQDMSQHGNKSQAPHLVDNYSLKKVPLELAKKNVCLVLTKSVNLFFFLFFDTLSVKYICMDNAIRFLSISFNACGLFVTEWTLWGPQ